MVKPAAGEAARPMVRGVGTGEGLPEPSSVRSVTAAEQTPTSCVWGAVRNASWVAAFAVTDSTCEAEASGGDEAVSVTSPAAALRKEKAAELAPAGSATSESAA